MKDILLGIAIGDAFGAGLEFQDRKIIQDKVDFSKYINLRDEKYSKNYSLGDYTDDAEMTIGLINAIMSDETFDEKLLLKYWKKEYMDDKKKKGFGRQGHGSIKHYYEGTRSLDDIKKFQKEREYPGNAPPMRAVPLGFLDDKIMNDYATINADATHPHPKARAASIIIARATEYILIKKKHKQLINYCKKHIQEKETLELLDEIKTLPKPEKLKDSHYEILCGKQPLEFPIKGINGLACDAMRTAGSTLYVLKHSKNTLEGLKTSIRMGGDVDSLASICTGILSGKYGLGTIPSELINNVEGKEKLERLADKFEAYLNV